MIIGAYSRIFEEMDEAFSDLLARDDRRTPICLNAHQAPHQVPSDAIVYNMENVGVQVAPTLFPISTTIWDMSARNVVMWRSHGRRAVHVPLGHHPAFEKFSARPWHERDVDVVLFGSMNARRAKILDELNVLGFRTVHLFDRYGTDRNDVLARSKIALNMLYYPNGFFPTLRLLKCVPNGVLTVSEVAPEVPAWAWPEPVGYNKLVGECARILAMSGSDADLLAATARDRLMQHPLRLPS